MGNHDFIRAREAAQMIDRMRQMDESNRERDHHWEHMFQQVDERVRDRDRRLD